MTTPEEKYYDGMNTLLAPVRAAKSLMQTLLIIIGVILVGLGLPFYCLFTGTHMTAGMWEFSGLTLMCLVSFVMAPWYTVLGGFAALVAFAIALSNDAFAKYMESDNAPSIAAMVFYFFLSAVISGILRRMIFRDPQPPSPQRQSEELSSKKGRESTQQLSPSKEGPGLTYEDLCCYTDEETRPLFSSLLGLHAPEENTHEATADSDSDMETIGAEGCNCAECADSLRILGLEAGADAETIKTAYRDLTKVWHPDRFADGDTRLKKKAEEQFKKIQAAYTHLQEHQPPPPTGCDIEEMPLKEAVECSTDAIRKIARKVDLLYQRITKAGLANRDDARFALGQSLAMQQDAISRLQIIIHRLERELPTFPRAELETKLAVCKKQRESMIELAVRGGLIQAR